MSLYLIIELCSLAFPLILSFDKKVSFYKHWKKLFPSIFLTGIIFVTVDIIFTHQGIWGFNPMYHTGSLIAGIPLEEWLFFLIIPYVSIFTHYVIIYYFPDAFIPENTTRIISLILLAILSVIFILFRNRAYTAFYTAFMAGLLLISFFHSGKILNRFYITYLVILVPFFLVNGILTGSFIADEVVWYNSAEITGFRIFTVPFEDIFYGFSLIYMNLLLMDLFEKSTLLKTNKINEEN